MEQFLIVLSVSLTVATISRFFSWFRQIPYTLLLVIVGLGLAFVNIRLIDLSPELILEIFLPPLLFEAAWNIKWDELKKEFSPCDSFSYYWSSYLCDRSFIFLELFYHYANCDRTFSRGKFICK